jgi:hypothetical protein
MEDYQVVSYTESYCKDDYEPQTEASNVRKLASFDFRRRPVDCPNRPPDLPGPAGPAE